MKIEVAKTAGFCFGVERAVQIVYDKVENGKKPVFTYGPIIHNEIVTEDLEKKGVRILAEGERDLPSEGTAIIRSHGVSEEEEMRLKESGMTVCDATCPFVKRIHRIVREASEAGRTVVIAGDPAHAEVKAITGWCKGPFYVVSDAEEASRLSFRDGEEVTLVSQTTFHHKIFQDIVEKIFENGYSIYVVNTICNATQERQAEARELARRSDAMIVIGGRQSSNTRKLFEISREVCPRTCYIQSPVDLRDDDLLGAERIGITAGASTPKKIIQEVRAKMSELNEFEQLLEGSVKSIHNGEVVSGEVIDVKEDRIVLNIGYKSDGIVVRNEYSNDNTLDLRTVVNVGDQMETKVVKVNDGEGQVQLSYKRLAQERGSKMLEEAFNNKEVVTATVAEVLKGGLSCTVDGTRIFIPASLVSDIYEKDLNKYANQEISFLITEFNPRKRRVIGDRKQLVVAEKEKAQKELFERITVGMTVEGTVKNVTDFGAFVDLGGADGLLHISEISWGRTENPKKVFKVGQHVRAFIKDINGSKIALSLKFPEENPWLTAPEKYATGNVVTGKVARMTDFGAFIELEPGIDALLHVSQIARERIEKPSDVLKTGQEVTARVVDFNGPDKKISLSIKALEQPVKVAEPVQDEDVVSVTAPEEDVLTMEIPAEVAQAVEASEENN